MASTLSIVSEHLKILRKACGSFGKRSLKDSLTTSEQSLNDSNSKKSEPNIIQLLDPFFHAAELDSVKYQATIIDCFFAIFKSSPTDGFHNPLLIDKLLHTLFKINKFPLEENRKKAVLCVFACIASNSGKYFVHARTLLHTFTYLLLLHNSAAETKDEIGKKINEIVQFYINQNDKPVPVLPFNTIEQASKHISMTIVNHTLNIQEYAPHCPTATIRDVDLVVMIRAFCSAIGKMSLQTSLLSVNIIQNILDLEIPFIQKSFFYDELRTTVHVALLSLCVDANMQLALPTAKLISTAWRRFSDFYNDGLNEVLDKGLATVLASPVPKMEIRSFRILADLVKKPQFMVDTFVNYDCDKSGVFHNIFENTVNIIVKRSYPEQQSVELQKEALKALLAILENLWKYFVKLDKKKVEKQEVAESVLNQKKEKNMIEQAQEIFKKSPNKGLLYFSSHNMCEDNPQSYADFLFNSAWLDPAGVGEVIGGSKPLNLQILPLFVGHFDFKGMSFEIAFRSFLSKFQIPGESQMIDRVMQEFGTKYYNDNSSMFSCADTVYVLSFSTLMLHTDAHHPNVSHHMTLEEFIRNNKGIDDGRDLPEDFIEELYRGITAKKINLTQGASIPNVALLTQKQQAELFKERIAQTLENAKSRTTTELHQHRFHRAESPLLIGPMFQCVWRGVLAALTMSFEISDDPEIVANCLKGFQLCTHIASHCYVEDALATLVDSFAKFTRLRTYSTELKVKNYQCTGALLECAISDRNFLKGAWDIILAECSALDKMSTNKTFITDLSGIEKLYFGSTSLDRESIKDFVQSLCQVSSQAMNEKPPRDSMIHGLENVAIYNMDIRPMVVWREIWKIMAELFVNFGRSDIVNSSYIVLDILNKLAQPFIRKEETNKMHHKEDFLQPFYDIFEHQSNINVKKRILDYISTIVENLGDKLQSGWKIIIQVLIGTAQQPKLISYGLEILQKVIATRFENVKNYQADMLLTAVTVYISRDSQGKIALQAVGLFPIVAASLHQKDTSIWLVLLVSLRKCQQHSNTDVRSTVENSLISIVVQHGFPSNEEGNTSEGFTHEVWIDFLTVFLPNVFSFNENSDLPHLTDLLKTLYNSIFDHFAVQLVDYSKEILDFLEHCLTDTPNFGMRHCALECLRSFVKNNSETLSEDLTTQLLNMMDRSIAEMVSSVLFVEVLFSFTEVFSENIERANKFITTLKKVSENCSRERSKKGVLSTWVAARECYFKCIVRQNREDEVVENLHESLEFYLSLRQSGTQFAGWDTLIANKIKETSKMENSLFLKCTKRSTEFICNLVEVEPEEVRKELVPLLKRQLEII